MHEVAKYPSHAKTIKLRWQKSSSYSQPSQTILEKFEFFPIKCRVQRSRDILNIAQEHRGEAGYKPFRLKVKVRRD